MSATGRGCVKTRSTAVSRNIDLSERAVFDYFRVRKGKKTPENEMGVCFHTALYGHRPVCQADFDVMPQRGTGCSLISGLVMQAEACGP